MRPVYVPKQPARFRVTAWAIVEVAIIVALFGWIVAKWWVV